MEAASFSCVLCPGTRFSSEEKIIKHIAVSHGSGNITTLSCMMCFDRFYDFEDYAEHLDDQPVCKGQKIYMVEHTQLSADVEECFKGLVDRLKVIEGGQREERQGEHIENQNHQEDDHQEKYRESPIKKQEKDHQEEDRDDPIKKNQENQAPDHADAGETKVKRCRYEKIDLMFRVDDFVLMDYRYRGPSNWPTLGQIKAIDYTAKSITLLWHQCYPESEYLVSVYQEAERAGVKTTLEEELPIDDIISDGFSIAGGKLPQDIITKALNYTGHSMRIADVIKHDGRNTHKRAKMERSASTSESTPKAQSDFLRRSKRKLK